MSSASLLGQAEQKLPPKMKEAWSMHTVKRNLDRPTLIDFNDWLKDKAEAHERMKTAAGKVKVDENVSNIARKITSKVFTSTNSTNKANAQVKSNPGNMPPKCVACKEKHPQREQNWLPTTSCASLVFELIISSDSAPSPANALKKVLKAPTAHFFTVPNEFSEKKRNTELKKPLNFGLYWNDKDERPRCRELRHAFSCRC